MPENDFLVFDSSGDNIMTQTNYAAGVAAGIVIGVADPTQANKAWRQGTAMAAMLALFIQQELSSATVIDDGTTATLLANFTAALQSVARQKLVANANLYVATTGNDSNPGTSGSPFLTVQRAINVALQTYDCNAGQYTVTINVIAGTYTQALTVAAPMTGGNQKSLIINGASSSTVNINSGSSTTTLSCVGAGSGVTVQNVTLSGGAAQSLNADQGGYIAIGTGVVFASAVSAHIFGTNGGLLTRLANYTITGSPATHITMTGGARLYSSGSLVVTLTGTPSFSAEFVGATSLALVDDSAGVTYSGAATGVKFSVTSNAVILSEGGTSGVNYPGSSGGTTATGGQII